MTSTNNLHNFLRTRRSIRRFKPEPVPDSVMDDILTSATFAPSAHNRQPWRFCVLKNKSTKSNLADAMAAEFERDLEKDSLPPDEIQKRTSRSRERMIGAPVVVILCLDMGEMDVYADTKRKKAEYLMAVQSMANAGMQMLLAAHAEGLGGVWVCSPLFVQATIQNMLDLPGTWEPQAMIFLGYPAGFPNPRERKSIHNITIYR